jgi:dihydroxyacetone kinase
VQAERIVGLLAAMARCAADNEQLLGELDSVAGDGDHGQGMVLGTAGALLAAEHALEAGAGARTALVRAGEAWSESAGGTSGAIWGAALTAAGGSLSDDRASTDPEVVAAVQHAAAAVTRLGGAVPGDKTMVDALIPFVDMLQESFQAGVRLDRAWTAAAAAATEAATATAHLTARLGRARTHGTHSLGHPDPGAVSLALLMSAVADELNRDSSTGAST